MIIQQFTAAKPTRNKNDDIAGFHGNTYWLMDGATQLVQPEHGKDASWHTGALDAAFRRALMQNPLIDLASLAKKGIRDVAGEFFAASGLDENARQELRPFSTLILVRHDEAAAALDYLLVSDSTLAVIGDGQEHVISDPRFNAADPLAPTDAWLRKGFGFDTPEFKEAMLNEVYEPVFKRINQPGGFDVAGQNPDVIDNALTGRLDFGSGKTALLMSDGFTRAIDTLNLYPTWTALLDGIAQKGGEAILKEIRDAETADYDGLKYQRSSRHDDATLMVLRLK